MTLCLVLKSMLVYVEVPTTSKPTMMTFVAGGCIPHHAHHLKTHPLIPKNTKEWKVWAIFLFFFDHLFMQYNCYDKNPCTKPMLSHNSCSKHHGNKQLIDLAVIHHEIDSCSALWDSLLLTFMTALHDHQGIQSTDASTLQYTAATPLNAPKPKTMMMTTMKVKQPINLSAICH